MSPLATETNMATKVAQEHVGLVVDLQRVAVAEQRPILAILRKLEKDLIDDLKSVDIDGAKMTVKMQARLNALLKTTQKTIATAYGEISDNGHKMLVDVAAVAAEASAAAVNGAIGVQLMSVGVPSSTLSALVSDTLIQGAPAQEWWRRQGVAAFEQFSDVIRGGVMRGEGWSILAKRVRGIPELQYADGLTAKWRRDSVTLVRTSVQSVANASQMAGYEANADLINGLQALATLDLRTSPICLARSGSAWDIETGKALPESPRQERFPGPPPWHFRCRTVLVPVLKPWSELATDPDVKAKLREAEAKLPRSTQASMDGQVSEDFTYGDWLKTKSEPEQIEVLGRGKWELWKRGQITMADLIDQQGNPLTLAQLKAKVAARKRG